MTAVTRHATKIHHNREGYQHGATFRPAEPRDAWAAAPSVDSGTLC